MAVKVAGKCPKCLHEITTDAPRNRVTWRGACPADGCSGQILARRVRGEQTATGAPDAAKPPAPAPARVKKSTVRKVTNDGRDPAATVPPAPRPGRPAADSPGQPSDDQQPAGEPAGQPPAEPAGRRPARAPAPESGATGRHPYAHILGW